MTTTTTDVKLHADCRYAVDEVMEKRSRYVILKIDHSRHIVEERGTRRSWDEGTYEMFLDDLQVKDDGDDDCRYGLYFYHESRQVPVNFSPLPVVALGTASVKVASQSFEDDIVLLVCWCPDSSAKEETKKLYSSSVHVLKEDFLLENVEVLFAKTESDLQRAQIDRRFKIKRPAGAARAAGFSGDADGADFAGAVPNSGDDAAIRKRYDGNNGTSLPKSIIEETSRPVLASRPKEQEQEQESKRETLAETIGLLASDFPVELKPPDFKYRVDCGLNEDSKKALDDLGLGIGTNLVVLQGRLLEREEILLETGQSDTRLDSKDGDWHEEFQNIGIQAPFIIGKIAIVFPSGHRKSVKSFYEALASTSPHVTLSPLGEPAFFEVRDTLEGTYMLELRKCIKLCPTMIIVVTPDNKKSLHSSVKRLLCCEHTVPSQILTVKVLSNTRRFTHNILVHMVAKVGGVPWILKPLSMKGIMVVGFDTHHDSANKAQFFGALVASMNQNFNRYFSACFSHQTGGGGGGEKDMSSQITKLFRQALRKYHDENLEYPKSIFFYRDGVGSGQVQQMLDHEVSSIRHLLSKILAGEKQKPSLTFIIVSKGINTRFFVQQGNTTAAASYTNPPPGTLVDVPCSNDFFLVSQSVSRQGKVVNPTSYNVVFDGSRLKPDDIQSITFKLCHLYYNWSGTIRVPAPCQYAHKLAYLCGESLHAVPSGEWGSILYFL